MLRIPTWHEAKGITEMTSFKTIRVDPASYERLAEMRRRLYAGDMKLLPANLEKAYREGLTRHRGITLGLVLDLAVEALNEAMQWEGEEKLR